MRAGVAPGPRATPVGTSLRRASRPTIPCPDRSVGSASPPADHWVTLAPALKPEALPWSNEQSVSVGHGQTAPPRVTEWEPALSRSGRSPVLPTTGAGGTALVARPLKETLLAPAPSPFATLAKPSTEARARLEPHPATSSRSRDCTPARGHGQGSRLVYHFVAARLDSYLARLPTVGAMWTGSGPRRSGNAEESQIRVRPPNTRLNAPVASCAPSTQVSVCVEARLGHTGESGSRLRCICAQAICASTQPRRT
jgi:hypothetical protein